MNTAIDFVLFGLLSIAGLPILVANFISTTAGMSFSFVTNRRWTFRSSASPRRSLVAFVLVTATGLWVLQPLVIALVRELVDGGGANEVATIWFAKACAIAVGLVWNFVWYRTVVFAPGSDDAGTTSGTAEGHVERSTSVSYDNVLLRVGSIIVAGGFLWVAVNVIVDPRFSTVRWLQVWTAVGAVVLLAVLTAAIVVTRRPVEWLERRTWARRALVAAFLGAMFCLQLRLGYSIRFDPGWDAGVMEMLTKGIVDGSIPVQNVADAYASYPNNLLLASLMTRYWQLWFDVGFTDTDLALMLVNATVLTLSALLTYLAARRLGRPVVAYVVLLLSAVFIGVSPWIGVVYSDTVGMLPIALIAYLVARLADASSLAGRSALWAAIGLVGAIGYQVKPQVVFAILGVAGVWILSTRWRSWTRGEVKARVAAVVTLVLGALVGLQAGHAVVDSTGLETRPELEANSLPPSHFLKMGASTTPGWFNDYYGVYNDLDVNSTTAIPPGPERVEHGYEEYRRRVADMGPVGYAEFLNHKATWVLGDGTFFAYGEGMMAAKPTPFPHTQPIDRRIQSFLGLHGKHFWLVVNAWQTWWLVVLLLMAAPLVLLRDRGLGSLPASAMRAALLGLVVFTLLFEGRSRYIYLYVPYFLLLASLAAAALAQRIRPVASAQPTTSQEVVGEASRTQ